MTTELGRAAQVDPGSGSELTPSVWSAAESLTDQILFRDWDYYIASFTSVKKYFAEFSTAPLWNFHFCGGRPELANPQNWTFTWLHPFIYLFEPVHLIILCWLLMTILGTWATAAFVQRHTGQALPSWTAGLIYALSGYFGAHFNQGIFTFAFFHLVPLMIYLVDVRSSHPTRINALLLFSVSFMFFTGALPHGLFYFYPAFLLFFALKCVLREASASEASLTRKAWSTGYPHLLALGVACYKLLPVAAWQRLFPRVGVLPEFTPPDTVIANLLRIDRDYDNMALKVFADQVWSLWEYNAYIGYAPILFAVFGLFAARRRTPAAGRVVTEDGLIIRFALLLILSGFLLSAGNAHWFLPGYWFKDLPLLSGMRVFARFQVLIVFGTALLAGLGLRDILQIALRMRKRWSPARAAATGLAVGLTIIPLCLQNALHISNIRGLAFKVLDERYALPPNPLPVLVKMDTSFLATGVTHHDFILRRGGIVANCYDPLTLAKPPAPFHAAGTVATNWAPLTRPAPAGFTVTARSAAITFPVETEGEVILYLTQGRYPVGVDMRDSGDGVGPAFSIKAEIPGLGPGLLVSIVSLIAFLWLAFRTSYRS